MTPPLEYCLRTGMSWSISLSFGVTNDINVSKQGVEKFITASPKLKYLDIRYGDNIIDPGYAIRIEQEHPNIKIVH